MNQQIKQKLDIHSDKIAELEVKLNHAYQALETLKQQNQELKNQVNQFKNNGVDKTNILVAIASELPGNNQSYGAKPKQSIQYRLKFLLYEISHNIGKYKFRLTLNWLSLQQYRYLTFILVGSISLLNINEFLLNRKDSNYYIFENQAQSLTLQDELLPSEPYYKLVKDPKLGSSVKKYERLKFIYNVKKSPTFNRSQKLDNIIENILTHTRSQQLSSRYLSLTLIDLNKKTISGYRQHTRRYPASVAKLFWMVAIKSKIQKGLIQANNKINHDLQKMIVRSDNNASSRIMDWITNTKSDQEKLGVRKFNQWRKNRLIVNHFFQKAGYKNIYLAQKTFPIYEIQMTTPAGPDLQLRKPNNSRPQANKITTFQAARLMSEIISGKAVTAKDSQQMLSLLKRKLRAAPGKKLPSYPPGFNPVVGFFAQSLSGDRVSFFASKAGWTSYCRVEVAYVESKDKKTRYILAMFGNNRAYSENARIFPQISRLVFNQMRKNQ
ncbi:MAG: serine hydrolase [Calothrix sp. MO_167.B12]|nr:serine hydrolase [Calothrix sp. MO_167.B12]